MTTNARDDKWSDRIDWSGGSQPLEAKTFVEVETREGHIETGNCSEFYWLHGREPHDIIAYRYQLPAESAIAEDDEEECIQLAYERMSKKDDPYSAYFKDVRHIDTLDVYRVIGLFECEKHGHPISHAVKKLLLTGVRTGGKDVEHDVSEAIDSLHRWLEMREEDRRAL